MKTLILASLMVQGIDARALPNPWLNAMEVRGDTAWFYVWPPWTGSSDSVVAFGRSRSDSPSTWVRRTGFSPRPVGHMRGLADSLVVDDEYLLVSRRYIDGREEPAGLVSRLDGARFPVTVDMSDETKLRLLRPDVRAPPLEREEIVRYSHGAPLNWARSDRASWFGLMGGTNEGFVGIGGLLRFDRETRTFSGVWLPELTEVQVTGLAIADGRLWIANVRPGEYGPYPADGLLAYDLESGHTERYTSKNSGLPDHLVQGVWEDGGVLWVSTRAGISRLDLADGSWTSAFHTPDLVGDSVAFNLVEGLAEPDSARINIFLAMQELGVQRREDFYKTASGLPREHFAAAARSPFPPSALLTHPALVPFLLEALDSWRVDLAAGVLERLPEADPGVREALARATPESAARMALNLVQMRHSVGLAWIAGHLDPAVTDSARLFAAITAVGVTRDTALVRNLVKILDTPAAAWQAASTLLRFDLLDDWETIGSWAMRDVAHWGDFLRVTRGMRFRNAWERDEIRSIVCTVAHRALYSGSDSNRRAATKALEAIGDPHGFPIEADPMPRAAGRSGLRRECEGMAL